MHAGGHRFDPGILHQLDAKTELKELGFRIELPAVAQRAKAGWQFDLFFEN